MQLRETVRAVTVIVAALLVLFTAACEEKTIRGIKADPSRYAQKEVGIVGEVVESYSILGRGAYEVDDGTGRLWVVSERGVPRKGSRVAVKGKVRDAFDLGSVIQLPHEVGSGIVMIEGEHRARN